MSETEHLKPRRDDEYELPGFQNPGSEQIDQAIREGQTLHCWAGVNIVKISPDVVAKFGAHVTTGEAKHMLYLAQQTKNVPLPKIFGYYRYGPHQRNADDFGSLFDTYIFMSFVGGETLDKAWDSYSVSTKTDIASQLRQHIDELRSIPSPNYIGSICHGFVMDSLLERARSRGPFQSEDDFNAALIDVHQKSAPRFHTKSFLAGMLSERKHRIVFAHGDLRPGNIMVKNGSISGIVDWELSGWYPEYWEFVKAFHVWTWQNDWTDYLLMVLDPYYAEFGAYAFVADRVW